jgi:hypothetical protein
MEKLIIFCLGYKVKQATFNFNFNFIHLCIFRQGKKLWKIKNAIGIIHCMLNAYLAASNDR